MSQIDDNDREAEQKPAGSPKTDQDQDEKAENMDQNEINENDDDEKEDTKKPLEKEKKAGVIYLSRIPTKMNVKLIREYMSQFGKIGRIYLEPKGIHFGDVNLWRTKVLNDQIFFLIF